MNEKKRYQITIQINEQKIIVYEFAKNETEATNNAIRQSIEFYYEKIECIKVLECLEPGKYIDIY